MAPFAAQDADFEVHVRESFRRLTLMRTIGANLVSVSPGMVEIAMPFRAELTADVFAVSEGQEKLVATMLATIMMLSDDRREPPAGETGWTGHRHHTVGQHGPNRLSRITHPWCVCGGRGFGQRLRDIVGIGR